MHQRLHRLIHRLICQLLHRLILLHPHPTNTPNTKPTDVVAAVDTITSNNVVATPAATTTTTQPIRRSGLKNYVSSPASSTLELL
jgi:hypothetical protein